MRYLCHKTRFRLYVFESFRSMSLLTISREFSSNSLINASTAHKMFSFFSEIRLAAPVSTAGACFCSAY